MLAISSSYHTHNTNILKTYIVVENDRYVGGSLCNIGSRAIAASNLRHDKVGHILCVKCPFLADDVFFAGC